MHFLFSSSKTDFRKPLEYNLSCLSHILVVLFCRDRKALPKSFAVNVCGMCSVWGSMKEMFVLTAGKQYSNYGFCVLWGLFCFVHII